MEPVLNMTGDAGWTGEHVFTGPVHFQGTVTLPDSTVTNAAVKSGDNISADKLVNRYSLRLDQVDGSDVVSETRNVHICRVKGKVKSVEVRPETAPTGGDKQFTVDVKKAANASGSYSSLLGSVITVDSTSVDDTLQTGALIADPSVADGDVIRIEIVASGSTGSQGQGVLVTVELDEDGT